MLAAVFFFLPTALIIIELSTRYPAEGGLYVWSKEAFGDFHGFVAGWAYWIYTFFYFPGLLTAFCMRLFRVVVCHLRLAMSGCGVLMTHAMVAFSVMLRGGPVSLSRSLVVLGGLRVCIFRHAILLG
jgi:amino acid transporter